MSSNAQVTESKNYLNTDPRLKSDEAHLTLTLILDHIWPMGPKGHCKTLIKSILSDRPLWGGR